MEGVSSAVSISNVQDDGSAVFGAKLIVNVLSKYQTPVAQFRQSAGENVSHLTAMEGLDVCLNVQPIVLSLKTLFCAQKLYQRPLHLSLG